MSNLRSKLILDIRKFQNETPNGIIAAPETDNILKWNVIIFGPDGTPWEDGIFKLLLEFNDDSEQTYPQCPPIIHFRTPIFHPNVNEDGSLDPKKAEIKWSSDCDIKYLLETIQQLLVTPNLSSPENNEAASLFNNDIEQYNRLVRHYTEISWTHI